MRDRSRLYTRLLTGQITPERYTAIVKRARRMHVRVNRKDRRTAGYFAARSEGRT